MSAGPSRKQIARASYQGRARFVRELVKLDGRFAGFTAKGGEHSATIDGVRVVIGFRLIHASNGEAVGWPVARMIGLGEPACSGTWNNPPWLGGCTPATIAGALDHYKGAA